MEGVFIQYPDRKSVSCLPAYTDFGKVQHIARSGLAYSIDYLPDGARGKSTWTSVQADLQSLVVERLF
ncbi:MAG: hypothetical protein IKQ59_06315 [Prevotella sp.]|nr:hypothetical protein [Bacteroidaceae bacterium]MBR6188554.1 hypothetical protein [Prevotella sp.]